MFEVKIIQNILPTQSSLFRARVTDTYTDVCPLCNVESQSVKHMLLTCSVSSSFWTCFSNWWQEKFNKKLTLSESTILYGWHKQSNNWEVLNYCLIFAKCNVFTTSVPNGALDFDSFLLRLNNKIDILLTVPWCGERPQNKRYSPRRKGKQSTNTTLHLFFCCCHSGELSFFRGAGGRGDLFFWEGTSGFFSK